MASSYPVPEEAVRSEVLHVESLMVWLIVDYAGLVIVCVFCNVFLRMAVAQVRTKAFAHSMVCDIVRIMTHIL